MTKSSTSPPDRSGRSGGIKPLNAPRVVYVRTDSAGNPVAVQVPPVIASPGARDPHPRPEGTRLPARERGQAGSPSLAGRELEGGSKLNRIRPSTTRKARDLRRNATPAENLLWKHLRKTQVPKYKFTRQYPIGPYFVDFCCRWARLVIELDGGHHATRQEADADRQQYLETQGYRVIRFWNNEVSENLEGVLFRIVEELEDVPLAANGIHPHPRPQVGTRLPARERGLAYPPSLVGRELEGGSKLNRIRPSTTRKVRELSGNTPPPLLSDSRWVKVIEVEDLWKVNDEWWRGPEEEIARLYYTVRLENSQQLTVYLDLIVNSWYRQTG